MRPVFQPPFFRCETSFSRLKREREREQKAKSKKSGITRRRGFQEVVVSDMFRREKKKTEEVNKANKCSQTLIVPLSASRRAASRHPHNLPLPSLLYLPQTHKSVSFAFDADGGGHEARIRGIMKTRRRRCSSSGRYGGERGHPAEWERKEKKKGEEVLFLK